MFRKSYYWYASNPPIIDGEQIKRNTQPPPENPFRRTFSGFLKMNSTNILLMCTGIALTVVATRLMREKNRNQKKEVKWMIRVDDSEANAQRWKRSHLEWRDYLSNHSTQLSGLKEHQVTGVLEKLWSNFDAERKEEAERVLLIDLKELDEDPEKNSKRLM